MKVLVLGATGFVGSYLVERALAAGHDVLGTSYNPTIDPVIGRDSRTASSAATSATGSRPIA